MFLSTLTSDITDTDFLTYFKLYYSIHAIYCIVSFITKVSITAQKLPDFFYLKTFIAKLFSLSAF